LCQLRNAIAAGVMTYADCWSDDLERRYRPLRQVKSRAGKFASNDQLMKMITTAMGKDVWQLAMYCGALAAGSGCRGGEIRNLQLKDISLSEGKVRVVREIAKNRKEREPRLMALAEWDCVTSCFEPSHSEPQSRTTICYL